MSGKLGYVIIMSYAEWQKIDIFLVNQGIQMFSYNKPVRSLRIVFSAHAILSRISHLLLFNQEQKKVKTKEGEKFGIKSHAH